MKILMHACCAPCSVACVEALRQENIEPTAFWYNPNIHPVTEYKARKNTLTEYAAAVGMPLIMENEYGLRKFIEGVYPDFEKRCGVCYAMRLEKAASCAKENGFDGFTTTLLISPYQNHELICTIGTEAAEKYGVRFLYRDFRPLFRQGQERARELGLYMQKYCGCIFSEEDRYLKKKKNKEGKAVGE